MNEDLTHKFWINVISEVKELLNAVIDLEKDIKEHYRNQIEPPIKLFGFKDSPEDINSYMTPRSGKAIYKEKE